MKSVTFDIVFLCTLFKPQASTFVRGPRAPSFICLARNFSSAHHDNHGHDAHSAGHDAHGHDEHHEHHESYYEVPPQDVTKEWIAERVAKNELPPPKLEDTEQFALMKSVRRRFWEVNQRSVFARHEVVKVAPPEIGETPFNFPAARQEKIEAEHNIEGHRFHQSMLLSSVATGGLFVAGFATHGNVIFDVGLSLAVPYHAHMGLISITNDYVYGSIRNGFQTLSAIVFGVSAVILFEFSLTDVGIIDGICQLWTTQPPPPPTS